jgi:hypothetical protein
VYKNISAVSKNIRIKQNCPYISAEFLEESKHLGGKKKIMTGNETRVFQCDQKQNTKCPMEKSRISDMKMCESQSEGSKP